MFMLVTDKGNGSVGLTDAINCHAHHATRPINPFVCLRNSNVINGFVIPVVDREPLPIGGQVRLKMQCASLKA